MYVLGFIIAVVFFSGWFSSSDKASPLELPAKLAGVKCLPPPEDAKHAETNRMLLEYDNYAIYQVCIPSFMMREKDKLKCGYAEDQMTLVCDEQAILQQDFVHSALSDIYAVNKVTSQIPDPKSSVTIRFSPQSLPIRKTRSKHYTKESYVTQGIKLPSKFRLRGDPICQSAISGKPQGLSGIVRESSHCYVDAAFGDLNLQLEIEALANNYDQFTRRDQINEINFWLNFLDQMVIAS